jgi:methyltransferase
MGLTGPVNDIATALALITGAAVFLLMAGEAVLSRVNEAALRRQGAIEPEGDVYRTMQWAYPGAFLAMIAEGAWSGPPRPGVLVAGLVVFGLAKALKLWAIASLGGLWSYRLLVLPGRALVTRGPYQWIRHPNYLAVLGEIVGVALTVWAPVTGLLALLGFGSLLRRRIAVEDRALGRQ